MWRSICSGFRGRSERRTAFMKSSFTSADPSGPPLLGAYRRVGSERGSCRSPLVIPDLIRDPCLLTPLALMAYPLLQAGGCPAASNFLLLRQKKVTKEKATRWSGSLRFATGNLRCSRKTGPSSNSASPQTIARPDPFSSVLLGPARRVGEKNQYRITNTEFNPECRKRAALPARESQPAVMFARGRSIRGQMKFPSIAQRGEGGARGGSGESIVLSRVNYKHPIHKHPIQTNGTSATFSRDTP
jgi:hypothetical protein